MSEQWLHKGRVGAFETWLFFLDRLKEDDMSDDRIRPMGLLELVDSAIESASDTMRDLLELRERVGAMPATDPVKPSVGESYPWSKAKFDSAKGITFKVKPEKDDMEGSNE